MTKPRSPKLSSDDPFLCASSEFLTQICITASCELHEINGNPILKVHSECGDELARSGFGVLAKAQGDLELVKILTETLKRRIKAQGESKIIDSQILDILAEVHVMLMLREKGLSVSFPIERSGADIAIHVATISGLSKVAVEVTRISSKNPDIRGVTCAVQRKVRQARTRLNQEYADYLVVIYVDEPDFFQNTTIYNQLVDEINIAIPASARSSDLSPHVLFMSTQETVQIVDQVEVLNMLPVIKVLVARQDKSLSVELLYIQVFLNIGFTGRLNVENLRALNLDFFAE